MLTVSRNSALFKTYNALSKTMSFSTVTPIKCNGDTDAFRDLCTFFVQLFFILLSQSLLGFYFYMHSLM